MVVRGVQKRQKQKKDDKAQVGSGSGLRFEKKHGQHILRNPGVLEKIVSAADIRQTDTVLEIGPGTGNLTMNMLQKAKQVHAIEIDPRMVAEVKKRAFSCGRNNLKVTEGCALRTQYPVFDVCVANMPYQISSPFTFKLLAHRPLFRCAVLMFQKEFCDRLVAECGDSDYGRLAVNVALFCKVTMVCKVSRGSFNPPPEVDSAVVKIVPRNPPIQVNFREWDGMMRIVFCRKNKILQSSFNTKPVMKALETNYKTYCSMKGIQPTKQPFKQFIMDILKESGLGEQRACKTELDEFFKLLLAFNSKGVHFVNTAIEASSKKDPNDVSFMFEDGDVEME